MIWQENRLVIIVTGVIALLSVLLMMLLLPVLPVVRLTKTEASEWNIPTTYKEDPNTKIEQLITRTLWKEPATEVGILAEDKPLTPPDWRIVAVIKAAATNQLVISFSDKPNNLQNLKVGDKLPGGHSIMRIEQNWIVISMNGKQSMLPVGRN